MSKSKADAASNASRRSFGLKTKNGFLDRNSLAISLNGKRFLSDMIEPSHIALGCVNRFVDKCFDTALSLP